MVNVLPTVDLCYLCVSMNLSWKEISVLTSPVRPHFVSRAILGWCETWGCKPYSWDTRRVHCRAIRWHGMLAIGLEKLLAHPYDWFMWNVAQKKVNPIVFLLDAWQPAQLKIEVPESYRYTLHIKLQISIKELEDGNTNKVQLNTANTLVGQ